MQDRIQYIITENFKDKLRLKDKNAEKSNKHKKIKKEKV